MLEIAVWGNEKHNDDDDDDDDDDDNDAVTMIKDEMMKEKHTRVYFVYRCLHFSLVTDGCISVVYFLFDC